MIYYSQVIPRKDKIRIIRKSNLSFDNQKISIVNDANPQIKVKPQNIMIQKPNKKNIQSLIYSQFVSEN
jgi:hypothetical protein